jgi:hypothetical protein
VTIAALVFLIVHLPWSWAAITGAENNPLDRESPSSPVQWLVTLFIVPLVTTAVWMGHVVQATIYLLRLSRLLVCELRGRRGCGRSGRRSVEHQAEELQQSSRTIDDEIGLVDQCRRSLRGVNRYA